MLAVTYTMTDSEISKEETLTLDFKASALILPLVDELYWVALSITRSKDRAEELVSECILRALEQLHTLRSEDRIKQWLLRILMNLWLQNRRKAKRDPEVLLECEDTFSFFTVARTSFGDVAHPEQSLVQQMLDEDINTAIAKLPDHYRIAIQLCDIEGMSYEEISHVQSIPIGTVRSRIARGRAMLQASLWQHAIDHGLVAESTGDRSSAVDHVCDCT